MAEVDERGVGEESEPRPADEWTHPAGTHLCDRCGYPLMERNCKLVCLNCGNQLDCSDLTLYFD
jgi:hypothetical protein